MHCLGKNEMFQIHFWVHKASSNSLQLHFLSNGSSELDIMVVASENLIVNNSKMLLDKFSNSLLVHQHTAHHFGVNILC